MKNEMRTPRLGLVVALCAVLVAIWMTALYGTYKEAQTEKYDVRVHPGAVSYGTHSSATIPMVSSPGHQTSVPMISGGEVRSYAHYGHASMPGASSSGQLHTTSSATVHTVGSGGGASGSSASPSGDRGASSRGISFGGVSYSMPTLALTTPSYASASESSQPARRGMGPRRVPGVTGSEYPGQTAIDGGKEYYWDGEEWIEIVGSNSEGDTKVIDGITYTYHVGVGWVAEQAEAGEDVPIGDAPWLWTILLAAAYGIVKMIRKKQNAI